MSAQKIDSLKILDCSCVSSDNWLTVDVTGEHSFHLGNCGEKWSISDIEKAIRYFKKYEKMPRPSFD